MNKTLAKIFRSRKNRLRHLLLLLFFPLSGCVTDAGLQRLVDEKAQKDHLAKLHTQLAVFHMERGQNGLARERLQWALTIKPDYPSAHNALGSLHQRLHQLDKAEWHYRRAILLNPSYSDAYNNLGVLLCVTGRETRAEEYFLKAIANPDYRQPALAMSNAGDCAYSAGDSRKAEIYLRRALSFDAKYPGPLLTMAELSFSRGDALSAKSYIQRYTNFAAHTAQSLWLGLRIEKSLGNQDAVSSYALLLKTHHPGSREIRLLRELETSGENPWENLTAP